MRAVYALETAYVLIFVTDLAVTSGVSVRGVVALIIYFPIRAACARVVHNFLAFGTEHCITFSVGTRGIVVRSICFSSRAVCACVVHNFLAFGTEHCITFSDFTTSTRFPSRAGYAGAVNKLLALSAKRGAFCVVT